MPIVMHTCMPTGTVAVAKQPSCLEELMLGYASSPSSQGPALLVAQTETLSHGAVYRSSAGRQHRPGWRGHRAAFAP